MVPRITPRVDALVSPSACFLPLRLRWEAFSHPCTIGICIQPTYYNHRDVGLTGWIVAIVPIARWSSSSRDDETMILLVDNFITVDLKGVQIDQSLWFLVIASSFASHEKFPSGYGNHISIQYFG
jgi:hypothetical protein